MAFSIGLVHGFGCAGALREIGLSGNQLSAALLASPASLLTRVLAWVVAVVMPFQVLTAVYLDVRGPAHVHAEEHDHHHEDGRVERHHHPAHDASVVVLHDGGLLDALASRDETPSGWSATMLAALASAAVPLQPLEATSGLAPRTQSLPKSRIDAPAERPPRTGLA